MVEIPLDPACAVRHRRRFMPTSVLRSSIEAGLRGARANLVPGLALQAFALALVVSYYQVPAVQAALQQLAIFRERTGFVYGIVATAFFGGVLPFVYLKLRSATRARFTLAQGAALTAFWAYKGLEIDLFYQFNAWLVGEGTEVSTIVLKALVDQGVYCPILAIPVSWIVYAWVEYQFNGRAVMQRLTAPGWYVRDVLPILLSNVAIWVPAVTIIYLLPTPLQLPLQNIVLCFFTLLLAHLTQQPAGKTPVARLHEQAQAA